MERGEIAMTTLDEIVRQIDRRAVSHEVGRIQDYRKEIKKLRRKAGGSIFGHTNNEEWAFHRGGRLELQFNVGIEHTPSGPRLRHGVAFSLEPSRSMPDIDRLVPKIKKFNEYLRENPDDFAGLEMWDFTKSKGIEKRSENYWPRGIPSSLVKNGTFVFLGRLGSLAEPDFEVILDDFDRLLALYLFVEGDRGADPTFETDGDWILFRAGCPRRALWAQATLPEKQLDIRLRHTALQQALYDQLAAEFGAKNVGTENRCRAGGRVDAVVRTAEIEELYEIKTASSARDCIREAMGQLLDYACWPGPPRITALVVVGEPPLSGGERAYLDRLNERFPVRLEYRQVTIAE
jgi:hypothetical protein